MTLIPVASFLAGSLLTLLLPTIMLSLLIVWYMRVVRRAAEPGRPGEQAQVQVPPQPPASAEDG